MTGVAYQIGDVVMIPIGDSNFAFGRLLRDASIAVFKYSSQDIPCMDQLTGIESLFDSGVFDTNISNGQWKIIGNIPFENIDESWPSPKYIRDIVDPEKYRAYDKGVMYPISKEEASTLEQQVMRKPDELVAEIKKRL